MPSMATPRKRSGENLNVWIDSRLVAALRSFLESTRPRTTKTAAIEEALEQFLVSRGFWPLPDDPADDPAE